MKVLVREEALRDIYTTLGGKVCQQLLDTASRTSSIEIGKKGNYIKNTWEENKYSRKGELLVQT
jgi:hypothetical protein